MSVSYDIVGDLHGNLELLRKLCDKLEYPSLLHPMPGRLMVFTGDLADRGPDNLASILAVREAVQAGRAMSVLGNHDDGLLQTLLGRHTPKDRGLMETVNEIERAPDRDRLKEDLIEFYGMLPIILHLDQGKLVVVHGALSDDLLTKPISAADRRLILNGEEIGKRADGKTLRRDWAQDYTSKPFVVYGHTPVNEPQIRHNTINVDTGAYRSGRLTAFRWPERQVVTVSLTEEPLHPDADDK